jgi:septal ring factor EnvC (AmiA/AmiB activator)
MVRRALAAALAVAALLGGPQSATAQKAAGSRAAGGDSAAAFNKRIQEQERKLQALRGEIQDMRKRDRELGAKEKDSVAQLRGLEREAATTADLLRTLLAKQSRVEVQLDGIRAEHDRATEILADRKQRLSQTLRAMYVRGTPTTAEVVLRSTTLRYALSHFKYMELLARNNERLVRDIQTQERYLASVDASLTQSLYELTTTADEAREEKLRLAQAQKARQSAIKRVRAQRAEYQQALADLSAAEKKVQSVIAVLEQRRQAALAAGRAVETFPDVGFARLRGSMPWPVRGRIVAGFGRQKHPKHGTITFNSGIDIAATEGTEVRSVARGQVEYVAWLDGYGRTVIVNHGAGYYTVYAHLSETLVAESQSLEPGAIIGRVGDTGSLDGPKLHFEVRAKADAVDPRLWLGR